MPNEKEAFLAYLTNNWPVPGSTKTFEAMRAAVFALAAKHIADATKYNEIERIARGDIRRAVRHAIAHGVPVSEIRPVMCLLVDTAPNRAGAPFTWDESIESLGDGYARS